MSEKLSVNVSLHLHALRVKQQLATGGNVKRKHAGTKRDGETIER